MKLRKDRVHLHGATNFDFKAKDFIPRNVTSIDLLSRPKDKNFSETVQKRLIRTAPNPLFVTENGYTDPKRIKDRADISRPRFAQLEEKELRKRVFVGDSNTVFDERLYEGFPRASSSGVLKKRDFEALAQDKHEIHGKASQETQLMGMEEFSHKTLLNQVNMEKVREIKRAIRRRYANRKNIRKIFNMWDEDSTGVITAKNVHSMCNKMGFNINMPEATVLLSTADRDRSNDLTLDEFLNLIFIDSDAINMNLESLPSITIKEGELDLKDHELIKTLQKDASQARERHHQNQLNLILKNKLKEIGHSVMESDQLRQGFIVFEKLEQTLKKLAISEKILKDDDIRNIFNQHKLDEHKFDYKSFIEKLKDFEFVPENLYKEIPEPKKKTELQKHLTMYDHEPKEELLDAKPLKILNINDQHISQIESIHKKARKVFRALKRYFPNANELDKYIMNNLGIEDSNYTSYNLSKKEFGDVIQNLFVNVGDKLEKTDVEGFLSVFIYNKHGRTKLDQISNIVFNEDERSFFERISLKPKGPCPPDEKKMNIANKDGSRHERSKSLEQLMGFDRNATLLHNEINEADIKKILVKLEGKVFLERKSALKVFREFDCDKDGYVTHEDIVKKIKEMNALHPVEIETFLQYVDPDQKGHLSFSEFSKKVRPNAAFTSDKGLQTLAAYNVPDKEQHEKILKQIPYVKQRIEELKAPYYPERYTSLNRATRYGASPPYHNSFINHIPTKESPMYLTDQERFDKSHNHRVEFQKTQKEKDQKVSNARVNVIRTHQNFFQNKIKEDEQYSQEKEAQKHKSKGLAQWSYEHRCHLKNEFI